MAWKFNNLKIVVNFAICAVVVGIVCGSQIHTVKKHNFPLTPDDEYAGMGVAKKNNHRPAECILGKDVKEIGSTWFADLGPPFGLMYCIRCECIKAQKKRRVVARVQCRNIKNECPEPTCAEPVLLPGRCCKSCPDNINSPDMLQATAPPMTVDDEEKNMKHFGTLMTSKTSLQFLKDQTITAELWRNSGLNTTTDIVATGRFLFNKKSLYYSFYVSQRAARPRALQFVDGDGNILEEHTLSVIDTPITSVYQNETGKICGVWKRLPRDYRLLLKDEKLYVNLIWGVKDKQEYSLSGLISRFPAMDTEVFSALLEPPTTSKELLGAGGTALVSISSQNPSIHITIVFTGIFQNGDVSIHANLELEEKSQLIMKDTQKITASDHAIMQFSSPVSAADLRLLSRGKLRISIENKLDPQLRISGLVITRVACEVFQTQLTGAGNGLSSPGLAWAYVNKDGALVYHVQMEDKAFDDNSLVTLMDASGKRKYEVEDLTPTFSAGWTNGSLEKLAPRILEPLYNNEVVVSVATQNPDNYLKGKLIGKPVADARDSPAPLLLKPSELHSGLSGMLWLTIDLECNMFYEVTINGLSDHAKPLQLYLEEVPLLAPGAPISRRLLEDFQGNRVDGFVYSVPLPELLRLDSGVFYLTVKETNGAMILSTGEQRMKVPSNCIHHYADNDVSALSFLSIDTGDAIQQRTSCYHESRFYDEGAQWSSKMDSCTMCHCHMGIVKCDVVKCPVLNCPNGVMSKPPPGVCCAPCEAPAESNDTAPKQGCNLAGKFYPAGSSWNPYIPPFGFDYCVDCTCDKAKITTRCIRKQCPPLDCPASEAIRPNKTSCCKQCVKKSLSDTAMGDEVTKARQKSRNEILSEGGCIVEPHIYENGAEWHPKPFIGGTFKCIFCKCRNGKAKCERKKCSRSACRQSRSTDVFKYTEPVNECCAQKCRTRRHQMSRHNMKRSQTSHRILTKPSS